MRACSIPVGGVVPLIFSGLLSLGLILPAQAPAQEVVFLIRHAERDWASDGGLVEAGRDRAAGWAEVFADTGLDVIITSEARRTKETGAPVASLLGVPTRVVPRGKVAGLLELLRTEYADARVLVVGHSGSIPHILWQMGHPEFVHIPKTDYNDLYVVRPIGPETVSVVQFNVD